MVIEIRIEKRRQKAADTTATAENAPVLPYKAVFNSC